MPVEAGQCRAWAFSTNAKRWAGWLVTAGILAAIGLMVSRKAGELSRWGWQFDAWRFSAAFVLVGASYPLFALAWRRGLLA